MADKIYDKSRNKLVVISLFLIASVTLIAILAAISDIVKLVIISVLAAYVLDPLASFFESRGMTRTSSTAAIFLFFLALAVISSVIFLPVLYSEIKALQSGSVFEKANSMVSGIDNFLATNLGFLGVRDLNLLGRIQHALSGIGSWLFAHLADAASVFTGMVLIPFVVFFLMKDGRRFKKAFVGIMPNRYFEFSLYLLHKMNIQIGNYLRGQLLDAAIVGMLSVLALWLLGVKYFFIIGVVAGLANIIPYFGPVAGAGMAVIVSVLQTGSFNMVPYIILAFVLIRLIDDVLIQPLVVAKSVHMHPLVVLLAILIGGKLFGILGMLLSVPVAGFIKVVVHESIINYRRYGQA
jgi:putative permease